MFSKGRKLVDLVNQTDRNKTESQDVPPSVSSQKAEVKSSSHKIAKSK